MAHVSELASKPWFLVRTNVCRHQNGGVCQKVILVLRHMSLVLTNICQQFQHQDHFLQTPHSGVDKCLSTPGCTLYTSMFPTPHQHLLSTSPAPLQHLPSTSQYLPPTQHLAMLRAVKSTCMLGAHMQAANLPGKTRGTERQ